jgi:hypothetical protein
MTTRISRLAGAILMESAGQFFLLGNTKEPCDWLRAGFEQPSEADDIQGSFIPLKTLSFVRNDSPCLSLSASERSPEELAQMLAKRFLISRNGSVSERLWRVVIGEVDSGNAVLTRDIDVNWLADVPDYVWNIVRDAVLKCS